MSRNERYFSQKPSKLKQKLDQRRGEEMHNPNLPEFSSNKLDNTMDTHEVVHPSKGFQNSKLPQFIADNKTKRPPQSTSYTALAVSSITSKTNSIASNKTSSYRIGSHKLGEQSGSPLPHFSNNPPSPPIMNSITYNNSHQIQQAASKMSYSSASSFTNGPQLKDNQTYAQNNTQTSNTTTTHNNKKETLLQNSAINSTHLLPKSRHYQTPENLYMEHSSRALRNSSMNNTNDVFIEQPPHYGSTGPLSNHQPQTTNNTHMQAPQRYGNPASNRRLSTPNPTMNMREPSPLHNQNYMNTRTTTSHSRPRPSNPQMGYNYQEYGRYQYSGRTSPNRPANPRDYHDLYGRPMNSNSQYNNQSESRYEGHHINNNSNNSTHRTMDYPNYPHQMPSHNEKNMRGYSQSPGPMKGSPPSGQMHMRGMPSPNNFYRNNNAGPSPNPNQRQLMLHPSEKHHYAQQYPGPHTNPHYQHYQEHWTPLTAELLFENKQFNPFNQKFFMPTELSKMETLAYPSRILGQGAYGVVIKARYQDPRMRKTPDQFLAIKLISNEHFICRGLSDQLKKEIKCHKKCNHPNILSCFACYETSTHSFLILEGMTQSLQRLAAKIEESLVMHFCKQLLHAMAYLHNNHIIHRDIKLDNILWNADNIIKLSDFGWCAETTNSLPHDVSGSFPYMAPEILTGIEQTSKVDIWSFGCCVFELFFGYQLFDLQRRSPHIKASMNDWNRAEMLKHHKGNFYTRIDRAFDRPPRKYTTRAMEFIKDMLIIDPNKRPSAAAALNHPWFLQGAHRKSPLSTSSGTSSLTDSSRISPLCSDGLAHAEMLARKNVVGNKKRHNNKPLAIIGCSNEVH